MPAAIVSQKETYRSSHASAVVSMPGPNSTKLCPIAQSCSSHIVYTDCRVSFSARLRFVSQHGTKRFVVIESQLFLQFIKADAEVLRLAVCRLYPAEYGRAEDVMTASLNSQAQQMLAVGISELHTMLVTGKEGSTLFGLVNNTMSGMT